jgi:hypothetical protein
MTLTMPLDDYLDDIEGTSPSDKYVIARVLNDGVPDTVMVAYVGDFESTAKEFRDNFRLLLGDGRSLYVQSMEDFADNAGTKH